MTTTIVVTNQGPHDVEVSTTGGAVVLRRQAPSDTQSYALWEGNDILIREVTQPIKPQTQATADHEFEMARAAGQPGVTLDPTTGTAAVDPEPLGEAPGVIGASDAPADPMRGD
jgi:hypothetical protein